MNRPVLFVDLDGTVRKGKGELGYFVNTPKDVEAFPEAISQLRRFRERDGIVIGITNQGGIGLGYITRQMNELIELATIEALEGQLDNILTCPHRPDAVCWCRKPEPGLFYTGLNWVFDQWGEKPQRTDCLMVGDMETDREAAIRAGIAFQWASEWRAIG